MQEKSNKNEIIDPKGVPLKKEDNRDFMQQENHETGTTLENESIKLQEENQKLKEKLTVVENQYLRTIADYQNLQKRTLQEKEELYRFGSLKTIEVLLPALDTFDYARQTTKPDSKIEKIVEDFNLVFEMLLKCLKDIGLETIDQTGIPFDPVYHEPLHQIPSDELPDHTITQVLKKGYILNKKVIRPALVSVSIRQDEVSS